MADYASVAADIATLSPGDIEKLKESVWPSSKVADADAALVILMDWASGGHSRVLELLGAARERVRGGDFAQPMPTVDDVISAYSKR